MKKARFYFNLLKKCSGKLKVDNRGGYVDSNIYYVDNLLLFVDNFIYK